MPIGLFSPWAAGGGSPLSDLPWADRLPKSILAKPNQLAQPAAISLTAQIIRRFKPAKALRGFQVFYCLRGSSSPILPTLLPAFSAGTFPQFLFPMPPCP